MADPIDMHNWDVVAGVRYDQINQGIVTLGTSPKSVIYVTTDKAVKIDLDFGDWQLTPGGAGQQIKLAVPITRGTVTIVSGTQAPDVTPISATDIIVGVNAAYLNQFAGAAGWEAPAGITAPQGPIQIATVSLPSVPTSERYRIELILAGTLVEWMSAQLNLFGFMFTEINVTPDLGNVPGFDWVIPWYRGFAVQEPAINPTAANCLFATMCLVDRPVISTQQGPVDDTNRMAKRMAACGLEVDYGVIPPTMVAGVAISDTVYLRRMILPAVPLMFSGIDTKDADRYFNIDDGGRRINNLQDVALTDYVVKETHVKPLVTAGNFTVEILEDRLVFTLLNATGKYNDAIDLTMSFSAEFGVRLDDDRSLTLFPTKSSAQVTPHLNSWWYDLELSLMILGAITTLVAAGLGGAGKLMQNSSESAIEAELVLTPDVPRATIVQQLNVTILRLTATAVTWETWGSRLVKVAMGSGAVGLGLLIPGVTLALLDNAYEKDTSKPTFDMQEVMDAFFKNVLKFKTISDLRVASAEFNGAFLLGLKAV